MGTFKARVLEELKYIYISMGILYVSDDFLVPGSVVNLALTSFACLSLSIGTQSSRRNCCVLCFCMNNNQNKISPSSFVFQVQIIQRSEPQL
jgi:hypothetical protein